MTQRDQLRAKSTHDAQSVIAVFDDWNSLQTVLEELAVEQVGGFGTVLYGRATNPPPTASSRFLGEAIELRFQASKECICCTSGEVAEGLTERLAKGARTFADALRSWLLTDQAWQLQNHIEKGRLVLWLQPPSPDQFGFVCGRLVRASRHLVALCNINGERDAPGRAR